MEVKFGKLMLRTDVWGFNRGARFRELTRFRGGGGGFLFFLPVLNHSFFSGDLFVSYGEASGKAVSKPPLLTFRGRAGVFK